VTSLTASSVERLGGSPGREALGASWRRALTIGVGRIGIELKALVRNPMAAMFTLAFPFILLLIFGSVFTGDAAPRVSFTEYFAAGMIASGAFYSGFQNLAIAVPLERDNLSLKRLRGTPMPPAAYFIGKTGAVIVVYTLQVGVLIGLGSALAGLQPPATVGRWLTFAWVSVLGLSACSLCGIALSGLIRRSEAAAAVVSPIVVVLQFISGVFFQYGALPGWMRSLASVFPLRWLALGMRSVFLPASFAAHEPDGGGWQHGTTALVLAAWAVVGFVVALRRFRWFPEERG
jgi:ABC-2 type transport system permease protein